MFYSRLTRRTCGRAFALPVQREEFAGLQEAIAPFSIPSDLVELLAWHDGGPWGAPWWPVIDTGHLLGAAEATEHYRWMCDTGDNLQDGQWRRSWLPIAHEQWYQSGIELAGPQTGLIVNASFPHPPVPLAPSLPAMLHAVCATIEAGIPSRPSVYRGPEFKSWVVERAAVVGKVYESYGGLPPQVVDPGSSP